MPYFETEEWGHEIERVPLELSNGSTLQALELWKS
jgi:hypothetical protein